jgi:hypothetical protein
MRRFILLTVGLFAPVTAYAVSITGYGWVCNGFLGCNTGANAVTALSAHLILAVNIIIIPLAIVVFLYGAILLIVSAGEERKEAGKKAMLYAALGLVFGILTDVIVNNIQSYIAILGS